MAIHVLSDMAGQEIELLAFDCFRMNPHYHYGPRNRNERIFSTPPWCLILCSGPSSVQGREAASDDRARVILRIAPLRPS
jgi:hypothetical protein